MTKLVGGFVRVCFADVGQHLYIVKHTVKGMHPGSGVAKLAREFAKLQSESEMKI